MTGKAQPLVNNQKIVNLDGTPTDYFIRWAQDRQIDITDSITLAQAQQLIDDWAAARDVIAGTGLSGGGNLSADVTLNLDASLDDLNDVVIIAPADGEVLTYDSGLSEWVNLANPGGKIYAPLVTGEIYAGQPRFVYDAYGQCILVEVS